MVVGENETLEESEGLHHDSAYTLIPLPPDDKIQSGNQTVGMTALTPFRSLALTGGGFRSIPHAFPMKEQIEAIQTEAFAEISAAADERTLDDAR
ncbi:MAG: hypothetical protein ABI600_10940, partial [Luteolibacter sp.]